MMSHKPINRLRSFAVGTRIKFPHDENTVFTIKEFKANGYVELSHKVTACEGHPCEIAK